jgi:hypothetical protein
MEADMDVETTTATASAHRILAVADWDLEPATVVSALEAHVADRAASVGLLVPARLHGIDWAGDPRSSRPCAERQLLALERISRQRRLQVEVMRVGDPEVVPATTEALDEWPAAEVLLFSRRRRFAVPHPLTLPRRLERASGLPVTPVGVPIAAAQRGGQSVRIGHTACQPMLG